MIKADICVIGAGSGGLSVAAGAAQLGVATVLVEAGKMGGDCLNYGCVPSKSLIAAAGRAQAMRTSAPFGIAPVEPGVDAAAVREHVREVIAGIAPHDSVERFEGLGVRVILGEGRFESAQEVVVPRPGAKGGEAGLVRIRARRFVIATGSRAAIPPVPGLDAVPYLTNETIFDLDVTPEHLLVLGGGPIGAELAQAHRRLGAKVSLVDIGPLMAREDPDLVAVVRRAFEAEGIELFDQVKLNRVEPGPVLVIEKDGEEMRLEGSHLLVATGRRPNIEALNLDLAGIEHDKRGIKVDKGLRTSNRRVYAIGDVAGGLQFTHLAGHHASIVIKSALFRLPAKADAASVPRVTFTAPEIASVGLSEAEAKEAGKDFTVLTFDLAGTDRARAERATEGFIKVLATPRGHVLGASIVGHHAGELILPWVMAIDLKIKLSAMAGLIAPYPTLSEISKRVAGSFYTPKLFGKTSRTLVRWLTRLG